MVISGAPEAFLALSQLCNRDNLNARRLHTSKDNNNTSGDNNNTIIIQNTSGAPAALLNIDQVLRLALLALLCGTDRCRSRPSRLSKSAEA